MTFYVKKTMTLSFTFRPNLLCSATRWWWDRMAPLCLRWLFPVGLRIFAAPLCRWCCRKPLVHLIQIQQEIVRFQESFSSRGLKQERNRAVGEKKKPELSSSLRIFSLTSSSHCCRIWTASSIEQFSTRMLSIASSLSPSSSVPVLKEEPLIGCLPDNFRFKQNILGINHLTFLSTIQCKKKNIPI